LAALYFDPEAAPGAEREPALLLMFNAAQHPVDFVLPALSGRGWTVALDSAHLPVHTELVLRQAQDDRGLVQSAPGLRQAQPERGGFLDGSSVSVAAGSVLV